MGRLKHETCFSSVRDKARLFRTSTAVMTRRGPIVAEGFPAMSLPGPPLVPAPVLRLSVRVPSPATTPQDSAAWHGAGLVGTAGSPTAQPPGPGQSRISSRQESQPVDPALSKRTSPENVPVVTRAVVGVWRATFQQRSCSQGGEEEEEEEECSPESRAEASL